MLIAARGGPRAADESQGGRRHGLEREAPEGRRHAVTMKINRVPSPNWSHRPTGTEIDCVVLHATASDDVDQDVAWCRDKQSKVSYHVIVDRYGAIWDLVSVEHRAWHAGVSSFCARPGVNDYSIGLSFANKNDGVEPYTEEQYEVGAALV